MEPTNTPTASTGHILTELQFKALVNHSHDGIIVIRTDGILLFASPAIEGLLGYRVDELLGKDPIFITHPQDAPELVALLRRLLKVPHANQTHQYRVFDKKGNVHWVESSITNCVDVPGVEGLVFNYRDITDETFANDAITALRQRRDNLINSIPELIWSVDENLRLLDANTSFYNKYLSTSGQSLKPGDHVIDVMHYDDNIRALWRKRYDTALQGKPYFEEYNTNGPLGWIDITLNPIVNNEGKVKGVVTYIKSINERKQIEEELKAFNRNRNALVNAIPDIIWSIDKNLKLVDANKAFYDYVYNIAGIHLKPGDDINLKHKAEDTISLWNGYYQHALKGNMFVEHSRFDNPTPGWHEVTLNPIVDDGKVIGVACYAKDITARKHNEEQQMAERLKRDALINNIPDLMWSVDAHYRLIDANKAFYKSMQQWLGMPVYPGMAFTDTPVDKSTKQFIIDKLNRALGGETFVENLYFEYQNIGWVEVTVSPIYDGNIVVGIACCAKNINERKQAEERIRQSEANMAHAQRMAGIGSWEANVVTGTHTWSEEAYRQLGYQPYTVVPGFEAFYNRIHPDDLPHVRRNMEEAYNSCVEVKQEARIMWPDGTIRWMEMEMESLCDETGKKLKVLGYNMDITDHKQAQEELHSTNINLERAQRQADIGSWEVDVPTNTIKWSKQAYIQLGYQPYSVPANLESFAARLHPNDKQMVLDAYNQLLHYKAGYDIEHRIVLPNGDVRWIASNTEIVEDHDGNLLKIYGTNQDITERHNAEENLNAERLKREALINNIPDLMWSIDTHYNLIDANRGFYSAILNLSGKPIFAGQNVIYNGLTQASAIQWINLYNRALKGETFTEEIFIVDHNSGWAEVTLSPIYDSGNIVGAACYSKDINKRKADEEQLIKSELSMAHAQHMAGIGSWDIELVDGNPFIITPVWSDETFRILGYDKEKDTPSLEAFIARVHPDDKAYVADAIQIGIANNDNAPIVYRVQWPDGTVRWIESEGLVEHDAQGNPTRIRGTHHDITEARLQELEREKITTDLMQRNNELEQFAYIVSHNLRGPVANIMGLSNELENMAPTHAMYTIFMGELKNSVNKLDEVIKDMSYILRLKREVAEQREVVEFAKLVEDIKGSINNMLREHNVSITTNFTDAPQIHTLKTYLYSVFYNLITNSIKYRQTNIAPAISITSAIDGDYTILQFTDNGIGIDLEKYGTTVFGLYKRFHTHIEGKGMGLYMVKSQVESLGGSVSIHSYVNQGTTFTVRLKN